MKTLHVALGCLCLQYGLYLSLAESSNAITHESDDVKEARAEAMQHPDDLATQRKFAALCLKEHLEADAITAAAAARKFDPHDPEANRLYVTALARSGKYQEAVDVQNGDSSWLTDNKTKKVLEAAALALKAEERLQQAGDEVKPQDYVYAATQLETAAGLDPDNAALRLTLGWIDLDKLGQPQAAYPHLEFAAKCHPQDPNARKLFASACAQTGHLRKAVFEFQQASLLQPNDMWIRANLGRTLAKLGRYSEAEKIYAEVLALDPANTDARLGQAEVDAWHGHSASALKTLDELLKENPRNVDALELKADIHRWSWDLTQARLDYQDVLDVAKDHQGAKAGLEEAREMGASDLNVKGYEFTDDTDFRRASIGAATRIHLADKVYLHAGGTGWQFHQKGFTNLDRVDGMGGLEFHPARWLELSMEGDVYSYEHAKTFGGAQASLKLSPTTRSDIYGSVGYNQPFVSSISNVINSLKENLVGAGLDIKLGRHFSFQNEFQAARISDDNAWLEEKPQLSYRLFGTPGVFLRAEYDFLTYKDFNPGYWTPFHRHSLAPVLDAAIPLGKVLQLDLMGKTPYIFNEEKFGYQLQGGLTLNLARWLQLTGSYLYSSIPGDQGAWSGDGGQAAMRIIF